MGTENWDWDNIKVSSFELLPEGTYDTVIISAEEKDTRSGGQYWHVGFRVNSGPCLGSIVYNNFNIENANLETQKWARSDIKAIALQNGREDLIKGPYELCGMTCMIKVSVTESEKYGEQNQVRILRPKTTSKKLADKAPVADFKDDALPF